MREVTLEDVVRLCEAAAKGDLEPRLPNSQPDPQMRRLVVSINLNPAVGRRVEG